MKAIRQKIVGRHLINKQTNEAILWLGDATADPTTQPPHHDILYVRYALTLRGTEASIFPAFVLDDWGHERNRIALYKWLRDEGDRYPRADLFGFDTHGNEAQHFLREFELHWKYPTYLYPTKVIPLAEGTLLTTIILTNDDVTQLTPVVGKPAVKAPLRRARVAWFYAPSTMRDEPDETIIEMIKEAA